ncbi:cytosine permease [Dictyobacter aurantiacus]|uniref:Uncharacterized protein n=1 Tax=Dictyobacter aurantiacus TaxID=1936993 RepID=A0A401Z9I3_9CHLR|nr:cytosine permease [Dictyobacter aurantiacus]GCE03540.1 hypothetical protein KDAU_08690 [Dictyobacter aurantiacus]
MSEEVKVTDKQSTSADEFLKVERLGMEPVLVLERHGSPRELAMVWTGVISNYVSLLTGVLVISALLAVSVSCGQLGLVDSALTIVLGAALAALIHGLVSATGTRTGTLQMIFVRAVYGHHGAYLDAATFGA